MEVPLLPSMVLVNLLDKERAIVFEIAGAVRYLFWLGVPATVSDSEINTLLDVKKNNVTLLSVDTIKPGDEVDMKAMGFRQQKGTVKHVSGNQCWVVLNTLGYVIKLQIQ